MKREIYVTIAIIAILATLTSTFIYLRIFLQAPIAGTTTEGLKPNTPVLILTITAALIGILIPIISLFSIIKTGKEIYKKKINILFIVLNVVIIILAIVFYFSISGLTNSGALDNEVGNSINNLFN